jgi:rhodanese-related sulfurtransferase
MRRIWTAVILLFVWTLAVARSAAQEHPATLPDVPSTSAQRLAEKKDQGKGVLVIDVRSPREYAQGHIPGARNIPVEELGKKLAEMKLPKDTTVVTVCEHGGRSSRAVVELQKLGYKTSSFCTLDSWKKAGYKLEKGEAPRDPPSKAYKSAGART